VLDNQKRIGLTSPRLPRRARIRVLEKLGHAHPAIGTRPSAAIPFEIRLVTHSRATNSSGRKTVQLALATALIVVAWRVVQLAFAFPNDQPLAELPLTPSCEGGECADAADATDAELARLYAVCPMATVVDLETVAQSPDEVDALLPPYRPTADRQPTRPAEAAVPRIRYPITLRPAAARTQPGSSGDNTQQQLRVAANPKASAADTPNGDWLIDPKEWYAPDKNGISNADPSASEQASETAADPASSVGGVSDADGDSTGGAALASETPPAAPADADRPLFAAPTEPSLPETLPSPAGAPAVPPGAGGPPVPPIASGERPAVDPHLELFAKNAYPSARECAQCHEDIYHEWSVSAHAYAAVSPMFHKFEQKLNDLSQGTVGYFCMRCHAPIATALCASRAEPLWNLPEVAREGVTCIACHRVQYVYGKSNGERRIEPGSVFAPVMGGIGGHGVAETIARKEHFKVKTSPDEKGPGQNIHAQGIYFDPLTRSEFCTPCHQVAVHPGIKLEVVWEQYRASPACKKGIQCQDCHMGRVPGLPVGYNVGPVAKMSGKTVNDHRKKSNHIFYGPNYSIAHPGIFPFHLKANRWTMDEWLAFDWRAGWGTDEFEDALAEGQIACTFPPVWAEVDDRYDAREIIEENLKKLNHKRDIRIEVMENGSHVEGPFFDGPLCRGQDLDFHYIITNTNEGHNLLTASLGAQPQFWANVVLIGPDGRRLWETGYTDSYGDLANIHSVDVRHKRVPFDWQLFNLQSMFLITGAKGTDREFYVPVNFDIDQLPFIRPGTQPISVINHPPFIRMESQSLAPLGARRIPYRIPGHLVQQPGQYRLSFRMRSRAEPIYFMRFCEATPEMERAMNEWMVDVHPMTIEFTVY
jgi:Cytochrome c554 and c-prime